MLEIQIISFIKLIFLSMVPFVLAGQGTMLGGRTGVFNVAQEGMMLVGASVGFLVSYLTGNLLYGCLAAMLSGGLFGLALAYFTTELRMDQFVIGLALFFIGVGLSTLLPKLVIGITMVPPLIPTLKDVPIPLLSKIPLLGDVLFNQNWLVYFSVMVSIILHYFLYKTRTGLDLRSVGENPMAADSLGVNVKLMRYTSTIIGGMLIGLAGAYLPMVYTGTFTEGMAKGRGWIAIALTFFGG
ncbi:MAG: ABC transporter permease, partial [Acidobacteriaceae bacterium]